MTKAIRAEQQRESGGDGEVGQRLRSLRMAAGLTQSQLAGGRFSKEYVSQIERGKTRPGIETLEWLAGQLDVEPAYLIGGVSAEERGRVEAALSRAEALSERGEHADAAETFAAGATSRATRANRTRRTGLTGINSFWADEPRHGSERPMSDV